MEKSLTFKPKKWLRSLTGGNPKKDTLGRDSGFNWTLKERNAYLTCRRRNKNYSDFILALRIKKRLLLFYNLDISLHTAPSDTFLLGCDHLFSCRLVNAHKHFVTGKFNSYL